MLPDVCCPANATEPRREGRGVVFPGPPGEFAHGGAVGAAGVFGEGCDDGVGEFLLEAAGVVGGYGFLSL